MSFRRSAQLLLGNAPTHLCSHSIWQRSHQRSIWGQGLRWATCMNNHPLSSHSATTRLHQPIHAMAIPTSFRAQRIAARRREVTQQLLIFRLQQNWFALPALVTQKVIQTNNLYGNTPNATTSLTLYQDKEIPVIDIKQLIFTSPDRELPTATPIAEAAIRLDGEPAYYLLIVEAAQQESIGLMIAAPPTLRRIPQSAFSPLSPTYLAEGSIRCISALIVPSPNEPPIFLLDLHQLLPSQRALPAGK